MSAERRNVVLTGFMGTGKSTVGRLLAERLGYEFVDTDQLIEAGHGPIAIIFAEQGEASFRAIERETASTLGQRWGLVIATGGGTLVDSANAAALGEHGDIVCLTAGVEAIWRRVTTDDSGVVRPLLAGPDPRAQLADLLASRAEAYGHFPQIKTDGLDPDEVAAAIQSSLADPD